MSLAGGDLTTPARAANWLANPPSPIGTVIPQLIGSMTALIYSKLSRARTYSQTFTRAIDGLGTYQIVLPDWPVTSITKIQVGAAIINPVGLPSPTTGVIPGNNPGYGYRAVAWDGNLPGDPAILEFVNGNWATGVQNIQVTYQAGYLIQNEAQTIPTGGTLTVSQPQGFWCRDNGVVYASSGVALVSVPSTPTVGQYIPPPDTTPGLYVFNTAEATTKLLISYSFVPADLEEACIQMIAERYAYRTRVGVVSQQLGGQETVRYSRGMIGRGQLGDLPPEVAGLIMPYVSVIPPALGAPV